MKTKTLCRYLGGSHLYELNTPASDIDERGVFINTDPLYIYGFKRHDNEVTVSPELDVSMWEFAHFLGLGAKSNTQTLECLFAPLEKFTFFTDDFESLVLNERTRFVDSERLFKGLEGYLHNEKRLALGERTGKLGGKRKGNLDIHGFSPKNFSHLFRLARAGKHFFETGFFPTSLKNVDFEIHNLCLSVKTDPETFSIEELSERADQERAKMIEAYQKTEVKYSPDLEYVGQVLKHFYSKYGN